jgi:HEAT repeat protein
MLVLGEVVVASVFAFHPGVAMAGSVDGFLSSGKLKGTDNPVLIEYLLEEGKSRLKPEKQKEALDQAVFALRQKANVRKDEQLSAALTSLVGMSMQLSGDDVVSGAGQDVEKSTYGGEWKTWVDSAYSLLKAGYTEDAISFFEYGLQNIPYPGLRARCVLGLAQAMPSETYDRLIALLDESDSELKNEALKMLGELAGSGRVTEEQKNTIVEALIAHTKGAMNTIHYRAAILGLDAAKDPRAVEALSAFKEGMMVNDDKQRPALRSLLLTYEDESVVEVLKKFLKGGFMSTYDAYDRLFAGTLLIEAGREEGFAWALKTLKPKKKKGFLGSSKDKEPDLRGNVIGTLMRVGGEESKKVLAEAYGAYKEGDVFQASIAIALLEMGDAAHIDTVRAALGHEGWDLTVVNAAHALAKHGDYSGVPVLAGLAQKQPEKASGGLQALRMLSGKGGGDGKAKARRIIRLRRQIASALGRIDHADGVPILVKLLTDQNPNVRSSAAYGLADMSDAAALDGVRAALGTDYGVTKKNKSRNPVIWAYLLRSSLGKFSKEKGMTELLSDASKSESPEVQFMALVNSN